MNDAKEKTPYDQEAAALKHRIYTELEKYRNKHGIGCFKDIAAATDGKVAVGTIAHMYMATKVNNETWRLVGEAMKALKQEF